MQYANVPETPGVLILTHTPSEQFYLSVCKNLRSAAINTRSVLLNKTHHSKILNELPGVPDSLTVTYREVDTHEQAIELRDQLLKEYYEDKRLINRTNRPALPGVYKIIHRPSQSFYMGFTRDLRNTYSYQMTLLKTNRHKNKTLQKLYDHGVTKDAFDYEFIVANDRDHAKVLLEEQLKANVDNDRLLNEKRTRVKRHTVGAYIIQHTPTGKFYIGSSKDVYDRWSSHLNFLKNETHPNSKLQALYRGDADEFTYTPLLTSTRKQAYDKEQQLLDKGARDENCLNISKDARSSISGIILTEQQKTKRYDNNRDSKQTTAFREDCSRRFKAYWADPENLEKRKGAGNPFAKVIVIGPFVFGSVKDAMHELDIGEKALRNYARDPAHKAIYFPADHYRKVTQRPHTPWEDTEAVKGLIDTLNPLSYGRVPIALDGAIYATTADAQKRTRRDFYEIKQAAQLLPVFCLDSHHRFSRTATLSDVSEIHYPLDKGNSP